MKTIVITGASSGIGKATAKHFAQNGWNVAATMRTPSKDNELSAVENIKLYPLDVTNIESINKAKDDILKDFNKVDVVLNNAGYGLWGPFEASTDEQIRRQFETNVFGTMNVIKVFLPHFRENNQGLFINIASIGGLITFPLVSAYHGTKWAVEGFSEALSFELSDIGIRVKIVEPGVIETDFQGRSLDWAKQEGLTAYDKTIEKFNKAMVSMNQGSSPATLVAEKIFEAANDPSNRLRYLAGADAEELFKQRRQAGDEVFVEGIRKQTLGD
ncbi:SDR family oxidoreductase [Aureibacter tunicatorum]|uniref:Short-subunit dehydrogenase n=1 Tax=Aureibacter tunicatorum TaxID=866807 RepID=A0AAE3XSN7_9BACT|nr:SDR family oxidoreductase [Aureibacter tunicatorum]MDR6241388.1 short-subunit dehydrogenase [Aureibacter tunicatorum]BDD06767.1 short-chain dehydrogenase [Aureibacter tunicatorum]